jgi:hypothetical protein
VNSTIRGQLDALKSPDDARRLSALRSVLAATEGAVDWIYEAWDEIVAALGAKNSYQRSIAAMVLCNLAKSDFENRLRKCLDRLLALTRDEKFITSRQCIQSLWKVAIASKSLRKIVVGHLVARFADCGDEKHYNLIRLDIITSLRAVRDHENGGISRPGRLP